MFDRSDKEMFDSQMISNLKDKIVKLEEINASLKEENEILREYYGKNERHNIDDSKRE